MTYLTQHLPFTAQSSGSASGLPPPESHLIITDTLSSPAHFAVYHLVASALQLKKTIIWVDFRGEGRASWETVLRKLGTPLPLPTSMSFVRIAPSSLPFPIEDHLQPNLFDSDNAPSLKGTYEAISKAIRSSASSGDTADEGPLILLDGLSELLWIGFEPRAIVQFIRATISLGRRIRSPVISTLHADHLPLTCSSPSSSASPASDLFNRLIRLGGGGWWRIAELESGRSGDVHGEISSHPLYPPLPGSFPDISRDRPLQYRLEANTVKVFPKGTGRGFL